MRKIYSILARHIIVATVLSLIVQPVAYGIVRPKRLDSSVVSSSFMSAPNISPTYSLSSEDLLSSPVLAAHAYIVDGKIELLGQMLQLLSRTEINSTYYSLDTLLNTAVKFKRLDIIDLLLSHGADINIEGLEGKSPLDIAREISSTYMINFLVERGAISR